MSDIYEEISAQRRKVDFDTYDISVQQLLSMLEQDQIDVAPEYQRHFRWKAPQQAQLIESLFLGIPVPSLFMAANRDGTWEVVDGVQRLSTLVHYAGDSALRGKIDAGDPLRLEGLEKIPSLNGTSYGELPESVQLQFSLRPMKVVTLSDKSDSVVRFDLFERLNTGGVKLTDQEIRACVFRGRFNDFLRDLASSDSFQDVVNLSRAKENDGTDEEMVLRFFAFYHRYHRFEHSVVGFLNDFMRAASKRFDYESGRALFLDTFRSLALALPDGIRREARRSTPINLYEAIAVGAALAMDQRGELAHGNVDWINSDELRALTTGATNTPNMVTGRIEYAARHFGWTPEGE